MKIAIPYKDGVVFGHFGQTETFAVFETDGNKQIIHQVLLSTQEKGHGALPILLRDQGVDVLLAGGMGQGAKDALAKQGITAFTGASGKVEDVVQSYLAGTFQPSDTLCQHHHGHGHTCHGSDGGQCHH